MGLQCNDRELWLPLLRDCSKALACPGLTTAHSSAFLQSIAACQENCNARKCKKIKARSALRTSIMQVSLPYRKAAEQSWAGWDTESQNCRFIKVEKDL